MLPGKVQARIGIPPRVTPPRPRPGAGRADDPWTGRGRCPDSSARSGPSPGWSSGSVPIGSACSAGSAYAVGMTSHNDQPEGWPAKDNLPIEELPHSQGAQPTISISELAAADDPIELDDEHADLYASRRSSMEQMPGVLDTRIALAILPERIAAMLSRQTPPTSVMPVAGGQRRLPSTTSCASNRRGRHDQAAGQSSTTRSAPSSNAAVISSRPPMASR